MTEAEQRIREALEILPVVSKGDETVFVAKWAQAVNPSTICALLADRDEREAALRAEVERLKAAIDMQPSPPTREDMEWAGKVFLAEAEKENNALRAEVEALRAALRECDAVARARGDKYGLCDCIDNGGSPYPSQWLADLLAQAKEQEA